MTVEVFPAWAAEVTPIPPVVLSPGPAAAPPETTPPEIPMMGFNPSVLPPAVTLEPGTSFPPSSTSPSIPPSAAIPAVPTEPAPHDGAQFPTETAQPSVSQELTPPPPPAEVEKLIGEEGTYFNVADEDLKEVIKQISRALGKNFILDDKACKGKITIISERKMTKEEVWETFLSALDANQCTVTQGPAGLYRLVPTREAISHPIDFYKEDSPFTDRFITRLITLKNISANDMANVIKGLVSKEGNLFAYPVTNTLILTDTGTNIDRLVRLIKELDTEGPQEILEIIPILYADAKDIANKITQIYQDQQDQKGGGAPARRRKGEGGGEGEDIPQIRKVIPDERTNSILLLATKRAVQEIHRLVKKLDSPTGQSGEIHVHYLKHAAAKDLSAVLSSLSGAIGKDKKGGGGAPPPPGGPTEALIQGIEILGKFTVTADESTNALVITASAKDYQTLVDRVISKLDIPRRQVYVEAVIIELSVSQDQQMGFGAIGGKQFSVGGANIAAFGSTFGFLDSSRLLGGTLGGTTTGTNITINTPGSVGSTGTTQLTVPAFFTALQLAQGNTDVNILSTPNILTLDNQEAEIKVGQKVPFPTAAATTIGGSLQTTFTREDVALTLKIKPQISESDTVRMEVSQVDREVLPQQEQPTIASQAGPSTTERSIKTAIVANNAQTIVLGGLIKDKYTQVVSKVPILGDIPLLGWLFKTRRRQKQKVNLVVFLTPHIIREPRDFVAILQRKVNEKNAFIENNFTRSQRSQIRRSLAIHTSHLLDLSRAERGELMPEAISEPAPLPPAPREEVKPQEPPQVLPEKKIQGTGPKQDGEAKPPTEEEVDLAL